jgi:hypothetical protein
MMLAYIEASIQEWTPGLDAKEAAEDKLAQTAQLSADHIALGQGGRIND